MVVRDIMTSGVTFCRPETNLAAAAAEMWQHDCGTLPIVDEKMHVTGMITDRDICIALATRNCVASEVTVADVATGNVFACRSDESVQTALSTMREHKVRRVPVVDGDGVLAGIVSIDDVVLLAKEKKGSHNSAISYADVIETHKAIAARPLVSTAVNGSASREIASVPEAARTGDFDFEE